MAKDTPQLENGYVRISTEWLEEFVRADYPGSLKEFVLVIARETWGWNETWREIPMPRIADILGVSVTRAKQMRDAAVGRNLIEWVPGKGPNSHGKYRVQKDYRDWIPHRTSGDWQRRHETELTGNSVLTGKDAITGKGALTETGKDALTSNREGRPVRLIDSERHSKDSKDSSPEANGAPGGPEEGPVKPTPPKPDTRTDTQKAIDAAWQAHGFQLPTGDHDKPHETTGNPTTAGFGGLVKLCNSKGLPLVREWTAHVAAAHPQVPDGANRWEWFKDQFRSALNRPWEWKQKRLDTGPRIAGDWSAPGAADPPEQV